MDPHVSILKDQLLDIVKRRQDPGTTTGVYIVACGGAHYISSTGSDTVDVEAISFGGLGPIEAAYWLRGRFNMR